MRLPVIGDSVHFKQNGRCYAATVVAVWSSSCVNLFVPPTGSNEPVPGALNENRNATSVLYDDDIHGRDWSWHWPTVPRHDAEEARG